MVSTHPDPTLEDSKLEGSLRQAFQSLERGDSLELAGTFGIKAELAAEFKGKMKVERQKDNSFVLEVEGGAELGLGSSGLGTGRLGVAAGTKFHVKTAAEAADLTDALVKGAVVTGSSLQTFTDAAHAMGVKDDVLSARSRVAGYLQNVSSVKAELTTTVQLGDEIKLKGWESTGFNAGMKANLQGRGGITIDLEKGELQRTLTLSVSGDASASLPLSKFGAGMKGTASLVLVTKVAPEIVQAIKNGQIPVAEAALRIAALPPTTIIARAEVEQNAKATTPGSVQETVKMKAEVPLEVSQGLTREAALDALMKSNWTLETEGSVGFGFTANLSAVNAEGTALRRYKRTDGPYSLEKARERLMSDPEMKQSIDLLRAQANLAGL